MPPLCGRVPAHQMCRRGIGGQRSERKERESLIGAIPLELKANDEPRSRPGKAIRQEVLWLLLLSRAPVRARGLDPERRHGPQRGCNSFTDTELRELLQVCQGFL